MHMSPTSLYPIHLHPCAFCSHPYFSLDAQSLGTDGNMLYRCSQNAQICLGSALHSLLPRLQLVTWQGCFCQTWHLDDWIAGGLVKMREQSNCQILVNEQLVMSAPEDQPRAGSFRHQFPLCKKKTVWWVHSITVLPASEASGRRHRLIREMASFL